LNGDFPKILDSVFLLDISLDLLGACDPHYRATLPEQITTVFVYDHFFQKNTKQLPKPE
jgi:hypothetical protein